ncbi:MAG: spinster family MFS transporter [Caulobacterales bacterium]
MADAVAPEDVIAPLAAPAIVPAALGYRRYALGLLLVIYTLNFLDRQVVNILVEPIKHDLRLNDAEFGLIGGSAFAVFYTFLAIPIARAAERYSRPLILGGSLALWSGFTAVCGLTRTFPQLLAARLGVGFGEAGCVPSAHSMIADDTPQKDRSFALAFYSMGTPLGTLLGFAIGGIVADIWGWRTAFFVAGAPGLALALVAAFTLREPRRRLVARTVAKPPSASFAQTMAYLFKTPTFWLVSFAAAISAFGGYGQNAFIAAFYLRNHAAEVAHLAAAVGLQSKGFLGLGLGVVGGLSGAFGSVLGGRLTDLAGARNIRAFATLPAIAGLLWAPFYVMAILAPSARLSIGLLIFPSILGTFWYGPIYGTVQSVVPPQMRATAAALLLFIINIIGLGLGPWCFGLFSDYLAGPLGMGSAVSIKLTLVISAAVALPSITLLVMARRTITRDIVS